MKEKEIIKALKYAIRCQKALDLYLLPHKGLVTRLQLMLLPPHCYGICVAFVRYARKHALHYNITNNIPEFNPIEADRIVGGVPLRVISYNDCSDYWWHPNHAIARIAFLKYLLKVYKDKLRYKAS